MTVTNLLRLVVVQLRELRSLHHILLRSDARHEAGFALDMIEACAVLRERLLAMARDTEAEESTGL